MEGPGEKDTEHVHADSGNEDVCRPVVDLAGQQAAADAEADIQCRGVCLRGQQTIEGPVGTVVDSFGHRRIEKESEVNASDDQDNKTVERQLTQQK